MRPFCDLGYHFTAGVTVLSEYCLLFSLFCYLLYFDTWGKKLIRYELCSIVTIQGTHKRAYGVPGLAMSADSWKLPLVAAWRRSSIQTHKQDEVLPITTSQILPDLNNTQGLYRLFTW